MATINSEKFNNSNEAKPKAHQVIPPWKVDGATPMYWFIIAPLLTRPPFGICAIYFLYSVHHAVDGRTPAQVEVGRLSHNLRGCIPTRWLAGFLPSAVWKPPSHCLVPRNLGSSHRRSGVQLWRFFARPNGATCGRNRSGRNAAVGRTLMPRIINIFPPKKKKQWKLRTWPPFQRNMHIFTKHLFVFFRVLAVSSW